MPPRFTEVARARRDAVLDLAQRLIRLPSPSGREADVADCLMEFFQAQGLDPLRDEVGNVVARRGRGQGPTLLLLAHMDTGEAGDRDLWEHAPFEAEVSDGYLHGLGAADSKGALAAMATALAALNEDQLAGTVVVAGVVMAEKKAGLGVAELLERTLPALGLTPSLVVMGDPTGLAVCLGQRGRMEIEVATIGRTAHVSAPSLGVNAAYMMAPVLTGLQELAATLPSHPFLERSTLSLTDLHCRPAHGSITPDRCVAALDRRFLPTESAEVVLMQIQSLISKAAARDPDFQGEARLRELPETAYTGAIRTRARVLAPFVCREDDPAIARAVAALREQDQPPVFDKWHFSTEAGYVAGTGVPTMGYAPGEEKFSHTPYDRVSLDALVRAVAGYMAIGVATATL